MLGTPSAYPEGTNLNVTRGFVRRANGTYTILRPAARHGRDWFPDEDFVLDLAGAWSVNPYLIEEEFPDAGPGFVGQMPSQRPGSSAAKAERPPPPTPASVPRRGWVEAILGALKRS